MKYFFTADAHLGHANIIKYCHRPFKDVHHMNEALITNWNNRVSKDDLVFHVGDFCFKNSSGGKPGEGMTHKASYYRNKLNGDIIFLKGNHDRNNSLKTLIESIVIQYGHNFIYLTHIPDNFNSRYGINFVGHVHNKWKFMETYDPIFEKTIYLVNVGVDVWNFQPVTFEEIYTELRRWIRHGKKEARSARST